MKSGLLTIFGVVAIVAAVEAGPATANEAPAIDAASKGEPAAIAEALPADTDPQVEEAVANTAGATDGDLSETPEAEIAAVEEASPIALDGEPTEFAPARVDDEGERADLQATPETFPTEEVALPTTPVTPGVTLGEVGYDEQGRAGRIHLVVSGDTLWDISDAYLGTPWVWPSVWTDNRDIENPHLIVPGDRIWITAHEMRRVSEEEYALFCTR